MLILKMNFLFEKFLSTDWFGVLKIIIGVAFVTTNRTKKYSVLGLLFCFLQILINGFLFYYYLGVHQTLDGQGESIQSWGFVLLIPYYVIYPIMSLCGLHHQWSSRCHLEEKLSKIELSLRKNDPQPVNVADYVKRWRLKVTLFLILLYILTLVYYFILNPYKHTQVRPFVSRAYNVVYYGCFGLVSVSDLFFSLRSIQICFKALIRIIGIIETELYVQNNVMMVSERSFQ